MPVLRRRSGSVLFVMAMSLTVLMGAAAWVVDLSTGMLAQTRFQVAADSAAIAATYHLQPVPKYADASNAAVAWAGRNKVTIPTSQVSYWDHPVAGRAVTVNVQQPVSTTFGRIFGILSMPVSAKASAALGGLTSIPTGLVPFGLPAYQDSAGRWFALTSPTRPDYSLLTSNPPTPIMLKVGSGDGSSGNYLALALDGTGSSTYSSTIRDGSYTAINYNTKVPTEPGNMSGPTKKSIEDRLARGAKWHDVYVPLVPRAEWESANGRSTFTIIGFVSVRITHVSGQAEVYAYYVDRVVPLPGRVGETRSSGVRAPVLVLPPGG